MTATVAQACRDLSTDLSKTPPRSPNALLGDFVLLARIIDKCRAVVVGTYGDYKFNCPLDRQFFDFTGLDAEAFKAEIINGADDDAMLHWVMQHSKVTDSTSIAAWCYQQRHRTPDTPESQAHFELMRRDLAPTKPHVRSWFELLDADEGRL